MVSRCEIAPAESAEDMDHVRTLFREYAASLGMDLSFQSFQQELDSLPGKYAPPGGGLWLARAGNTTAGCVAIRPLDQGICEMKRLYVRPEFRGQKLGLRLARLAIAEAARAGYSRMRLDTLASLKPALTLYQALGFREIAAYNYIPSADARYFEMSLSAPPP